MTTGRRPRRTRRPVVSSALVGPTAACRHIGPLARFLALLCLTFAAARWRGRRRGRRGRRRGRRLAGGPVGGVDGGGGGGAGAETERDEPVPEAAQPRAHTSAGRRRGRGDRGCRRRLARRLKLAGLVAQLGDGRRLARLSNADHNLLARQHGVLQPIGDPVEHASAVDQRVRWPRCCTGVADTTEPSHVGVLVKRRVVGAEEFGAIVELLDPKCADHLVGVQVRVRVRVRASTARTLAVESPGSGGEPGGGEGGGEPGGAGRSAGSLVTWLGVKVRVKVSVKVRAMVKVRRRRARTSAVESPGSGCEPGGGGEGAGAGGTASRASGAHARASSICQIAGEAPARYSTCIRVAAASCFALGPGGGL
eukprot:scaffold63723_cov86-Phaeocystis_antarctica.AAC.2